MTTTPVQDYLQSAQNAPRYFRRDRSQALAKARSLHRKHRGAVKQLSHHGCGRFSVQFFNGEELVADYTL